MTKSTVRFFSVVFLVALFTQGALWWSADFVDEWFWLEKIEFLKEDIFSASLVFNAERHAAHPGTPVLLPAAVVSKAGLSAANGLRLVVTLINAAVIAGVVTMIRRLRMESPWWLGTAGIMLFNPVYQNVNPLDVIASSLTVFIFLTLWWYHEKRRGVFLLAILLGIIAATRLHVALLLAGPVLGALVYRGGLRQATLVSFGAVVTTLILVPFMWLSPIVFMQKAVVNQFMYFTDQTVHLVETSGLSLWELMTSSPLAVSSLFLAVIGLMWKRYSVLPRFVVITLLTWTATVLGAFGLSNLQSYRYVFPVIMVWEVLVPVFILHLVRQARWSARLPAEVGVMLLLTGTYMVLLVYSILLPEPVYI